jgi:hypothetical protein
VLQGPKIRGVGRLNGHQQRAKTGEQRMRDPRGARTGRDTLSCLSPDWLVLTRCLFKTNLTTNSARDVLGLCLKPSGSNEIQIDQITAPISYIHIRGRNTE